MYQNSVLLTHAPPLGWVSFPRKTWVSFNYKSIPLFIGSGGKYRSFSICAASSSTIHFFGSSGIFLYPYGNSSSAVALLALCLVNRTNFAAGIPCIKLVESDPDSGKIVVDTVGNDRVIVVVDGNEADIMLGKGKVDQHTRHSGVS